MKPKTKELIKEFAKCGAVIAGSVLLYEAMFVGTFAALDFVNGRSQELLEDTIFAFKFGTFVGALGSPVAVVGAKGNHKLFWKNRSKKLSPTITL